MARLYADEQYPLPVVEWLRKFGHDVLTTQEAGNAGQKIPDEEVLAFAIANQRAVLTLNRRDFVLLHTLQPKHCGIIICSEDKNWQQQAKRVNDAIAALETLNDQIIRIKRPQK